MDIILAILFVIGIGMWSGAAMYVMPNLEDIWIGSWIAGYIAALSLVILIVRIITGTIGT